MTVDGFQERDGRAVHAAHRQKAVILRLPDEGLRSLEIGGFRAGWRHALQRFRNAKKESLERWRGDFRHGWPMLKAGVAGGWAWKKGALCAILPLMQRSIVDVANSRQAAIRDDACSEALLEDALSVFRSPRGL